MSLAARTIPLVLFVGCLFSPATAARIPSKRATTDAAIVTDIPTISQNWGQIRPYADNAPGYFGVQDVGLPDGCGIEQVHQLQRHGARYPTGGTEDGLNDGQFAAKIAAAASAGNVNFTGPLSFLSEYRYDLASTGLLVESGAAQTFSAGVQFWNLYGRLLYNAPPGSNYYNSSFPNGTARPPITFRTTSQARIIQSAYNFIHGFFGYQNAAANDTGLYNLVVITEGGTENNTLASYDPCLNDNVDEIGYIGDDNVYVWIPQYLNATTSRLQSYIQGNLTLNNNDTYAMQSICAYEYNALGSSDFCSLFTIDEKVVILLSIDVSHTTNRWVSFGYSLSLEYNYDYSFLNPTGRAQGIGYVQELLARIQDQYITNSNTSVNASLDNNPQTFPLGQPMYVDVSHDDIIISTLTALGLSYLNVSSPLNVVPPAQSNFNLSFLTPFAGRLTTEILGCNDANPNPQQNASTTYSINSNGYNASTATNKFVRMRLNQGILPINTLPGGYCNRPDALCSLENFIATQANSTQLANYAYVCFANASDVLANFNGDGSSFAPS